MSYEILCALLEIKSNYIAVPVLSPQIREKYDGSFSKELFTPADLLKNGSL